MNLLRLLWATLRTRYYAAALRNLPYEHPDWNYVFSKHHRASAEASHYASLL